MKDKILITFRVSGLIIVITIDILVWYILQFTSLETIN